MQHNTLDNSSLLRTATQVVKINLIWVLLRVLSKLLKLLTDSYERGDKTRDA